MHTNLHLDEMKKTTCLKFFPSDVVYAGIHFQPTPDFLEREEFSAFI